MIVLTLNNEKLKVKLRQSQSQSQKIEAVQRIL